MDNEAELLTEPAPREYPAGDYAIVELFGHTTLVGRIAEVERFGTKMLAIEPLFCDEFLPAIFHGGAAIYRLTPCTSAVAFKEQPTREWQLPPSIQKIVPTALLPAPATEVMIRAVDGAGNEFEERDIPF